MQAIRQSYHRAVTWLEHTPNVDRIDQRNGIFFQLFLIYFFVSIFGHDPTRYVQADVQRVYMAKAWGAVLPWPRVGMYIDFATDALMGLACMACFVIIRRRPFRQSVQFFLASLLGLMTINYMAFGSMMGVNYAHLSLIVAALMLGRRALWIVYVVLVANYTIGQLADSIARFHRVGESGFDGYMIASVALNLFVIAALLDQTVKAIRDSLAKAEERGDRLALEIIEREKSQQQIIHLEKMRAIGQLAGGTAHDFNNILGIILGFARERRRPGTGTPQTPREIALCEALEGVEVAARRGASVSRKLLDFSRIDPIPSRVFDVSEALNEIEPMLRQLVPDNVRLSMNLPSVAEGVVFNREQFELALLNLTANARDAMPHGGGCSIIVTRENDDWISVAIEDTGEGMSEETRQRVFEPFFTTKPAGIGTGLGLSVVLGLVERSGGRMTIESEPGKGTTVTMSLRRGHVRDQRGPKPDGDDIRVLLIDDDETLRDILVAALEDYGCNVMAAKDGRSALQYAQSAGEAPHIIVCDHHMPDIDGTAVMRHLRYRFPETPAILISTGAPGDQAQGAPGERNYRLPKPFSPDRLAAKIFEIVLEGKPV